MVENYPVPYTLYVPFPEGWWSSICDFLSVYNTGTPAVDTVGCFKKWLDLTSASKEPDWRSS